MRPAMQKALQAMAKKKDCKELLSSFAQECLADEEDHSLEWKEGLQTLSTTQWNQICEYLVHPQNDLHVVACFTCLCWSVRDMISTSSISSLSQVILHLHAQLLQATPEAQDAIAQCCEAFWISRAPGAEAVIPQLIPYLVVQALDVEKSTAIKRLKDVQDALTLLDYEDESSRILKDLLLRCFISPVFLKSNDGVQILADLFHLDSSFTDDIHTAILNQIPMQKKAVVKRYGLIYFKAWQTAHTNNLPSLLKIEEDCIQPFLYHAIYVHNASLCTRLHSLLQAFFDSKQICDSMLARLVEPIIWRGLSASNDQVRKQAAILLFQGFPFQNSNATKEDIDVLLLKQLDIMIQLVQDNAPATRVVAVHGLSKVLSLYWELVPQEYIQQFLFWLFEMVQDVSSTPVRVAVLQGLSLILDNHLSHPVLKSLLPKLQPYLHDKQESVRTAFCQLLVRVKSIRNMHFYDIATVEACLSRLVIDSERLSIAKALTELFLRSYFPQGASETSQVARTLSLIEEHPAASRVFYRHVIYFSSVGAICKLVVLLVRFLSSEEDIPADVANGIVWVVVDLLQSVDKPLHRNKRYAESLRFLQQEIDTKALANVFKKHQTHRTMTAGLWTAISYLPLKNEFILKAFDQLAKFKSSSNKQLLIGVLKCLVQWNEESTFIETLLDQLHPKRIAKANLALLLVCIDQLMGLCDVKQYAQALISKLVEHWESFQKQLEPASAVLYAKIIWSLAELISAEPPLVLCDVWDWLAEQHNKRKGVDSVSVGDVRIKLVPILCEAMFAAMQSGSSFEFMQRILNMSIEEPALNAQLLALLVASEAQLDDKVSTALISALLDVNGASCAWLVQMKHSAGLCENLWSIICEDAEVARKIRNSWPESAIRKVLAARQENENYPEHIVDILEKYPTLPSLQESHA